MGMNPKNDIPATRSANALTPKNMHIFSHISPNKLFLKFSPVSSLRGKTEVLL